MRGGRKVRMIRVTARAAAARVIVDGAAEDNALLKPGHGPAKLLCDWQRQEVLVEDTYVVASPIFDMWVGVDAAMPSHRWLKPACKYECAVFEGLFGFGCHCEGFDLERTVRVKMD